MARYRIGTPLWSRKDPKKKGEVTGRVTRGADGYQKVRMRWLLPERTQEFSCRLQYLTDEDPALAWGLKEYDAQKHRKQFDEFWDLLSEQARDRIFKAAQEKGQTVPAYSWSIIQAIGEKAFREATTFEPPQESPFRREDVDGDGDVQGGPV